MTKTELNAADRWRSANALTVEQYEQMAHAIHCTNLSRATGKHLDCWPIPRDIGYRGCGRGYVVLRDGIVRRMHYRDEPNGDVSAEQNVAMWDEAGHLDEAGKWSWIDDAELGLCMQVSVDFSCWEACASNPHLRVSWMVAETDWLNQVLGSSGTPQPYNFRFLAVRNKEDAV